MQNATFAERKATICNYPHPSLTITTTNSIPNILPIINVGVNRNGLTVLYSPLEIQVGWLGNPCRYLHPTGLGAPHGKLAPQQEVAALFLELEKETIWPAVMIMDDMKRGTASKGAFRVHIVEL